MEPEKARLKRLSQELKITFIWWVAGGFFSAAPFFAALISAFIFTPLAILCVILAMAPPVYLIFFQKYFFDSNAEIIKNGNLIFRNRPLAYLILLTAMVAGSICGWMIFSAIIGSNYRF